MSVDNHQYQPQISPTNLKLTNNTTSSLNSNASTSSTSAVSTNSSTSAAQGASSSTNLNKNENFIDINNLKLDQLPAHIRFELDQLELELLEGDITQKGYEKKKSKLLSSYLANQDSSLVIEQSVVNKFITPISSAKILDTNSNNSSNCKCLMLCFFLI